MMHGQVIKAGNYLSMCTFILLSQNLLGVIAPAVCGMVFLDIHIQHLKKGLNSWSKFLVCRDPSFCPQLLSNVL